MQMVITHNWELSEVQTKFSVNNSGKKREKKHKMAAASGGLISNEKLAKQLEDN